MKRPCIIFLVFAIIILSVVAIEVKDKSVYKEYLRIHIRANSNSQIDQQVKYEIKDNVVNFLAPHIASCKTYSDAEEMLKNNLSGIERVADGILKKHNFSYTSSASVKLEEFPTRTYQNLTLESGVYRALIINLGSGAGDNWWCVVYPPLCFTHGDYPYQYRSAIIDIINNFFVSDGRKK